MRGETFVTRKITRGLARIQVGLDNCLFLGNLDARRDWGHAKDFVRAQWLMLQQEQAADYVVATGEQHSVREFVELAGRELGMRIHWSGAGTEEKGVDAKSGRTVVRIDPRYFRPAEVDTLLGDASLARSRLGWQPDIGFEQLVAEMAAHDRALAERDASLAERGYRIAQARD
jgi:GDPmannose 4,6-dehydratase